MDFDAVVLLFLFNKHCPIMKEIGLKDSSRDLQANCAISFCFYLYLMLYACAARFDVTENFEKFLVFEVKALFRGKNFLDFATCHFRLFMANIVYS